MTHRQTILAGGIFVVVALSATLPPGPIPRGWQELTVFAGLAAAGGAAARLRTSPLLASLLVADGLTIAAVFGPVSSAAAWPVILVLAGATVAAGILWAKRARHPRAKRWVLAVLLALLSALAGWAASETWLGPPLCYAPLWAFCGTVVWWGVSRNRKTRRRQHA